MNENKINEVDILKLPLNLKYLEAEFTRTPPLVSRSQFWNWDQGRAERRESDKWSHYSRRQEGDLYRQRALHPRYRDTDRRAMNAPTWFSSVAHWVRRQLQCQH